MNMKSLGVSFSCLMEACLLQQSQFKKKITVYQSNKFKLFCVKFQWMNMQFLKVSFLLFNWSLLQVNITWYIYIYIYIPILKQTFEIFENNLDCFLIWSRKFQPMYLCVLIKLKLEIFLFTKKTLMVSLASKTHLSIISK